MKLINTVTTHVKLSAIYCAMVSAFALPLIASADQMILSGGFNLRARPNKAQSSIIQTVQKDTRVEIVDTRNRWTKVKVDGRTGWVHTTALKALPGEADRTEQMKPGTALQPTKDSVNLRAGPKDPNILMKLNSNDALTYKGFKTDAQDAVWYEVEVARDGKTTTGFVFEGLVTKDIGDKTEGDRCINCPVAQRDEIANQGLTVLLEASAHQDKGFKLPNRPHPYNGRCSNFISSTGIGSWGQTMIDAVDRIAPRCFRETNIFVPLCSNFKKLNRSQQNQFIALFFAALAQVESSCDPTEQTQGTNDTADGIFQLEYTSSARAKAGRNKKWCRTNDSVDTQGWSFQSECAVSTIEDTICDRGRLINSGNGYWEKLRNNRKIVKMVQQSAIKVGLCK